MLLFLSHNSLVERDRQHNHQSGCNYSNKVRSTILDACLSRSANLPRGSRHWMHGGLGVNPVGHLSFATCTAPLYLPTHWLVIDWYSECKVVSFMILAYWKTPIDWYFPSLFSMFAKIITCWASCRYTSVKKCKPSDFGDPKERGIQRSVGTEIFWRTKSLSIFLSNFRPSCIDWRG